MALGINQVTVMGNLTRDPEIKHTNNNTAVLSLSMALNYRKKSGDDWEDAVEFIPVTFFGSKAETVAKYLRKGDPLVVLGRLQTRSWEGSDGQRKYKTEVVCNDIRFVGHRKRSDDNGGVPENKQEHFDSKRNGYAPEPEQAWLGNEEADIPF